MTRCDSRAEGAVASADRRDPVILAEGVTRTFRRGSEDVYAVRAVDLRVDAGEVVVLRGHSGSGKTTLLNCLGGLDQPDAGRIVLAGTAITSASRKTLMRLRRERVGYVFQHFGLVAALDVRENIGVPLRISHTAVREREARVDAALEAVGLGEWAAHRPPELSGGQQQRVALARAIVTRPAVLLADEPTGQLDSETGERIVDLLVRLAHEDGIGMVIASHSHSVFERADRLVTLRDGAVVA